MPREKDSDNVFDFGNSYAQVEKDREQYEIQVTQEQELKTYRIEPEIDLMKEQEKHYERIRRYFDPGFYVS